MNLQDIFADFQFLCIKQFAKPSSWNLPPIAQRMCACVHMCVCRNMVDRAEQIT